jgi:hypothetical protein
MQPKSAVQGRAAKECWPAQAFPGYTDCHLRLACIAAARGDSDAALDWARRALERRPKLADAQAMLGAQPLFSVAAAVVAPLAAFFGSGGR